MATFDSISAKLQRIIDSANGMTHNTHKDLTRAVNALIAGYTTGVSSGNHRTLTFMGADGESVAGTVAVTPKYSCAANVGPVLTKEPTESIVYNHIGWSLTPGGDTTNFYSNITEDVTLYPVFSESARTYAVRFFDGSRLVATKNIPYGESSSYVYNKIGAYFRGWDPQPINITADLDCYGTWEYASFATDTWTEISTNSYNGRSKEYYAVGDEREMAVTFDDGSSETVTLKIADIKNGYLRDASGSTLSGREGMFVVCISPFVNSNIEFDKELSWAISFNYSDVNAYLNKLIDCFPEQLKTRISAVSLREVVNFENTTASQTEYVPYELWPLTLGDVGAKGTSMPLKIFGEYGSDTYEPLDTRIMKLRNGEAVKWWLHDMSGENAAYVVMEDGSISTLSATTGKAYVVFGFFI